MPPVTHGAEPFADVPLVEASCPGDRRRVGGVESSHRVEQPGAVTDSHHQRQHSVVYHPQHAAGERLSASRIHLLHAHHQPPSTPGSPPGRHPTSSRRSPAGRYPPPRSAGPSTSDQTSAVPLAQPCAGISQRRPDRESSGTRPGPGDDRPGRLPRGGDHRPTCQPKLSRSGAAVGDIVRGAARGASPPRSVDAELPSLGSRSWAALRCTDQLCRHRRA